MGNGGRDHLFLAEVSLTSAAREQCMKAFLPLQTSKPNPLSNATGKLTSIDPCYRNTVPETALQRSASSVARHW